MKKLLIILVMTLCITSCTSNRHTFSFSLGDSTESVDSIFIETKRVLICEEKNEIKEFISAHMKRGEDIEIILDKTLVLADAKKVKFKRTYINNASFLPTEAREICYYASETNAVVLYIVIFIFLVGIYFNMAISYDKLLTKARNIQKEHDDLLLEFEMLKSKKK